MSTDIDHELGQPLSQAEQVMAPPVRPHGHYEPYYLLANCRRLLTHPRWKNASNWVIARELFATGSTSAVEICRQAGIDPDGKKVERLK